MALASFHLEFHIHTIQSFKVKSRGKKKWGGGGSKKIGQVNGLPGNGAAVYHLANDFILEPFDFATELVL